MSLFPACPAGTGDVIGKKPQPHEGLTRPPPEASGILHACQPSGPFPNLMPTVMENLSQVSDASQVG